MDHFDRVWDWLAYRGLADGRGGAEYRRVRAEWEREGKLAWRMSYLRERIDATAERIAIEEEGNGSAT